MIALVLVQIPWALLQTDRIASVFLFVLENRKSAGTGFFKDGNESHR